MSGLTKQQNIAANCKCFPVFPHCDIPRLPPIANKPNCRWLPFIEGTHQVVGYPVKIGFSFPQLPPIKIKF